MNEITRENIAETLAKELPKPQLLMTQSGSGVAGDVTHFAVPKGYVHMSVDDEALLPRPRLTVATAQLGDSASFLSYVALHAPNNSPAVWCSFDPTTYRLSFEAVFDEHAAGRPGWRKHRAKFEPRMSAEWLTWTGNNGQAKDQLQFAEFIEKHDKDIAGGDGFPSSLDMLKMATAFEANADKKFKSSLRLASGGVSMQYVNTDDEATIETMRLFEKFQIGLPVFWSMPTADSAPVAGWPITARLKYRVSSGAVKFWYDLIRPDLVHQAAAVALIDEIHAGLGGVPLRMGSCG